MARIDLVDLAHAYRPNPAAPSDYALRPMTMRWEDGGAYALLGPSGCGKTTLLNIISGLVRPSHGRVLFDGRDVTALPPEARNIAQVFQFPVIYDTMTVFDNLAFPLRNRGWKEGELRKRVEQVAAMLELSSDLKRRASGLAADAKQKISLGRGLVRPDVAAVLFDEPLTVIDPHLKWLLRRKLKEIHHELKLSLIYVTHDQVEALTFADQVVVMTQGEVVQTGSAQALFEEPAHTFVGYFIGNPGMNLLPCTLADGAAWLGNGPDGQLALTLPAAAAQALAAAGQATLGIRPEFVECLTAPQPEALPATLH
ncbi:MAG: ABC transporter ATP-binding protein, partial [Burkholderiaceae bacterium]